MITDIPGIWHNQDYGTTIASNPAQPAKSSKMLEEHGTMTRREKAEQANGLQAYRPIAILAYFNQQNRGGMTDADGRGFATNDIDGDHLELTLKVSSDQKVSSARFRAAGCPALIAAGSVVTRIIEGNSLHVAMSLTPEDVDYALGGLPELRRYVTTLVINALRQAVFGAWEKQQPISKVA